jgi:hypothetical protein
VQKDFEVFIGQGEQAQGVMEAHQRRGHCGYEKKKKKKKEKERRMKWEKGC